MHFRAGFILLQDNLWDTYLKSPKGLLTALAAPVCLALFFKSPQDLYVWYVAVAWLFFATITLSIANGLTGNRVVFERYPIPIHFFLYFPIIRAVFNFTVAYAVLILFLVRTHHPWSWQSLVQGYVLLLPLAALGAGLGLVFSVLGILYRWNIAFPLFFLSLLPLWKQGPLSALITFPSDILLKHAVPDPGIFIVSSIISFLFLALAVRFFHITQVRLYEKCR